jgi:hypothetical protein
MCSLIPLGHVLQFFDHRRVYSPSWDFVFIFQVQDVFWETKARLPWLAGRKMLEIAELDTSLNAFALVAETATLLELEGNLLGPRGGFLGILRLDTSKE